MTSRADVHVPHGSSDGELLAKALTAAVEGVPVLFVIPVAAGEAAGVDLTVAHKTRIVDAWAVHTGGDGEASDTLTVQNGENAITDAMDWSGLDTAIVRAGEINDAYHEIAAGGTLCVSPADADEQDDLGAGIVYVLGVRCK